MNRDPSDAARSIDTLEFTEQEQARFARLIADGARKLRRNGDVVAGLTAAHMALVEDRPMPRAIAEWLGGAIGRYLAGREDSIDKALGLKGSGRSQPLRKARESFERRAAIGSMLGLYAIGATVEEAARLATTKYPRFEVKTLKDHFSAAGYVSAGKLMRRELNSTSVQIENALREYPDRPLDAATAKARIRARRQKSRSKV